MKNPFVLVMLAGVFSFAACAKETELTPEIPILENKVISGAL